MEKISQKTQDFIDRIQYEIRHPSTLPTGHLPLEKINIVTRAIFENANSDVYVFSPGLDDFIFSEEMKDTIYKFFNGLHNLKILFKQDVEQSSLPEIFREMIVWKRLKIFCGVENFEYGSLSTGQIRYKGYPVLSGFMCANRFIAKDNKEHFGTYNFRYQEKERDLFILFYSSMVNASKSKKLSHV